MAEKRVRSPTGETPVQETKRPSRTPWNVEEKEFLEKYVKAAGGIPRTSTMKFWEKCAEDLNKTFSTARTAQMCRCKITKVKNLMEDFESAQDIMHTLVNQFSQTDVSLCSDANTNLEPQPHLKMDQLPTFKNSETTTEAEKSIQSSLLDRLGSDNMFSCAQKSECINIILNSKTKGHFIDYLFQDAEFKSEISRKLSKEMELNASTKCIRNPDSYLFNKNYDDLKQFSFQNVIQEMSQCQPDLLKFLLAVAVPSNRIGKPVSSLLPKFSLIYSILMSSRFHELSRLQRVISTVLMEEQVHEKVFDRLQKLGVSTSPDVCSRLLDDIGGHFNNEVIALLHAGKSFRFVGDNVNFTVGVKSERQDSKPQVCNWFASCVITQTLTFPDLLDVSQGRTRDLDVSHFLPTAYDERKLKDDYKVLISRIVKTFLPHLTFLYEGQPKHILGQYSHHFKQKNFVMPTKVLPLNEQNYADCVKILSEYEDTLENIFRQAGIDIDHARPIHIGGDQLTRERFSGAKSLKSGCFSAKERFDHLSPITFELWHTAMNFLKLIFTQLYNKCGSDKGTIEGERVLRQRENVKEDVKNNYDQDKDFFLSFLKAYVVEALCSFFGMNTKFDNPTKHIFPPDLSKAERKNWVEKTLDEFLDQYVFVQKSDASLSQMHEIEERRTVPLNVTLPGGTNIVITSVQTRTVFVQEDEQHDRVKHYGHLVLELGLLFMQFLDVCKTPDRDRLLITLKYMMVAFKTANNQSKYALEILRFLAHQQSTLSLRTAHEVLYGLFVNTQGKIDSNIPADLQMEHVVKRIKQLLKNSSPNCKQESTLKKTQALSGMDIISNNYDKEANVLVRYSKHKVRSAADDEIDIIEDLREVRPFEAIYGRSFEQFEKVLAPFNGKLDRSHIEAWIDHHKYLLDFEDP